MLSLKARDGQTGKLFNEQKIGEEFFHRTGRWRRLRRLIDRCGNRYLQHIEDAETGEVLQHVDEPLTEHQGHGSARPKS
jgi:hypothetical protein